MEKLFDYAIIGGDKRMAYMGEAFIEKGFQVIGYGLDKDIVPDRLREALSLEEALGSASVIIGPLPLSRDGSRITGGGGKADLTIECLKKGLKGDHSFYAGSIPEEFIKYSAEKKLFVCDYMKDETLTIFNTVATAEGAIAEAIANKETNLHGSRCLVTGFGRCGKTLAAKLSGLAAQVTICARRDAALSEAGTYGHEKLKVETLEAQIQNYDYIFNTVPEQVIDKRILKKVKKEALIIDIASAPGGVDFEEAKKCGISAKLCLGLPGKYAPKSSGMALADVILKRVKKEGVGL